MKKTLMMLLALGNTAMFALGANLQWDNLKASATMTDWMNGTSWIGGIAPSTVSNTGDSITFDGAKTTINFAAVSGFGQGAFNTTNLTITGNSAVTINNILEFKSTTLTIEKGSSLTFGTIASNGTNINPSMSWNIFGALAYNDFPNFSGSSNNGFTMTYNLADSGSVSFAKTMGRDNAKFTASVYSGEGHKSHTLVTGYGVGNTNGFTINGGEAFTGTKNEFLALEVNETNAGKYYLEKDGATVTLYSIGTATIPEPSSTALAIIGLGGLLLRRRR